jgi:hypothetical protein
MRARGVLVYDTHRQPFDVEIGMSSDKLSALSDEEQLGDRRVLDIGAPFFVLSAQDVVAPAIVRLWADLMVHDKNCPLRHREAARRVADDMERWQKNRGIVS